MLGECWNIPVIDSWVMVFWGDQRIWYNQHMPHQGQQDCSRRWRVCMASDCFAKDFVHCLNTLFCWSADGIIQPVLQLGGHEPATYGGKATYSNEALITSLYNICWIPAQHHLCSDQRLTCFLRLKTSFDWTIVITNDPNYQKKKETAHGHNIPPTRRNMSVNWTNIVKILCPKKMFLENRWFWRFLKTLPVDRLGPYSRVL